MKNDDFAKQLTSKLDHLAIHHRNKAVVMDHVLEEIHAKPFMSRFSSWKMTGFALAAAITGFVILPNAVDFNDKQDQQQMVVNPKLSPQMMEDLEMLSVFGEDKVAHGS
ncbi:hypothetical protein G9F32_07015 [Acinetobacter sp. 194]|uniref:hypothetical protein n=1 Tax=Acinetobacter shaoyimingii TaxID=2715164 RepID=UPI00140D8CDF|nr:hypothetical protein [Acinetobacter shaoyimingii]NHB57782.1 hypothetical protein [Acinetobacter shaoyimingii]